MLLSDVLSFLGYFVVGIMINGKYQVDFKINEKISNLHSSDNITNV